MSIYTIINTEKEQYRRQLEQPEAAPPTLLRVGRCIHNHLFAQKLSVAWIRVKFRISDHNFSTRFARYFLKPPKPYIVHHRITAGKKLLSNPKLLQVSIAEIAFEIGYNSSSAFSGSFKRKTGLAPGRWREQHLNG